MTEAMADARNNSDSHWNLLEKLFRLSVAHPRAVLGTSFFFAVLSLAYTIGNLEFKTGRNDLISSKDPAVKRYQEISEDFGRMTHATVVAEGHDPQRLKQFITDLADRLAEEPDAFHNLFFRIDTSPLEGKKLLYLSEQELVDLKDKLTDYRELLEELAFTPGVTRILAFINQKISEATVSHLISELINPDRSDPSDPRDTGPGPVVERNPVDLSFLKSLLEEIRSALSPGYRFRSPWDTFFDTGVKITEDGFLISDDDRFAYMVLDLKGRKGAFTQRQAALDRLRFHLQSLLKQYPDLDAGVTGEVALATDEMTQAFRDTLRASVLALVGIGLLFMLISRQVLNPLWVLMALVTAICWTFGWVTLTIGHLTILSVAFTPILMGLGIDFGIHLVARFREEAGRGHSVDDALAIAVQNTGKAIAAGALTTALAFFAVMLADFKGIQELGFIAGSGVLLSLIGTYTVLPALLVTAGKKTARRRNQPDTFGQTLGRLDFFIRHPGWTFLSALIVTLVAILGLTRVGFDYNLLNLQAEGTESVVWERKIIEHAARASWFALDTAGSLEETRRKDRRFGSLPVVRKVDSLADLIPEDQEGRIRAARELNPIVNQWDLAMDPPEPLEGEDLLEWLEKIKFKLRTDVKWDPRKQPDEKDLALTRQALLDLIGVIKAADPETVGRMLDPFQKQLFSDFVNKFQLLKDNTLPSGPILETDIPRELKDRFKSSSGTYLLQVFSEKNVWEKESMTAFVNGLRSVEPTVTGSPVVGFLTIHAMRQGYVYGSLYALIALSLVIWATFRRVRETCLTLLPLGLTLVWTMGWMGWSDVPFNLANVIALPLILGIVVDDGIHVVHRFREDPKRVRFLLSASTAQAVTLTSWTTMIGFGALLISRHFGIFSLGLVVTLAVGTAWILSLVLLPLILRYRAPIEPYRRD